MKYFIQTILLLLISTNTIASAKTQERAPSWFVLHELLLAHQTIAHSTASNRVNRQIDGSIALINEKKYEIVSFIFENPSGNLGDETFEQYLKQKALLGLNGEIFSPIEGVTYEIFDSSQASVDQAVYFYISVRALND